MDITSAKIFKANRKVAVQFSRRNGHDKETVNFVSADAPNPSFVESLKNLHGDFCFLTEQPKDAHANITLIGVIFGEKGGRATYRFVAYKSYAEGKAGYTITTSPFWEPSVDGTGIQSLTLTEEQCERLEAFRDEATQYVEGARNAQTGLQLEEEEEEEESAEPVAA